ESLPVVLHDLVLFDLCESIGIPSELWMRFNLTRFIEDLAPRLPRIAVHGEGTDADESPQAPVSARGVEEIARRDHGVHERVRKRLLAPGGRQMKDDGDILGGGEAVGSGQQIARDHLELRTRAARGVELGPVAGRPRKTAHVAEPAVEQGPDEPGPDETGGPGDEDGFVGPDEPIVLRG